MTVAYVDNKQPLSWSTDNHFLPLRPKPSVSSTRFVFWEPEPSVSSVGSSIQAPILQTEDEFSEYEDYDVPNWDGYGAKPISPETVRTARHLYSLLSHRNAPLPDIAPCGDGTIGFEWFFDDDPVRKIFIDVGPGDRIRAYRRRHVGAPDKWPTTSYEDSVDVLIDSLFPRGARRAVV